MRGKHNHSCVRRTIHYVDWNDMHGLREDHRSYFQHGAWIVNIEGSVEEGWLVQLEIWGEDQSDFESRFVGVEPGKRLHYEEEYLVGTLAIYDDNYRCTRDSTGFKECLCGAC